MRAGSCLAVLLVACSTAGSPSEADTELSGDALDAPEIALPESVVSLTSPAAWAAMGPDDDPFVDHRPSTVDCPGQAWGTEGLTFEIDTGLCDYLTVSQPLAVALSPDHVVAITVGHFPLVALEPAEAHAALVIDGEVIWEVTVPIPAESGVYEATWTPPRPISAGAPFVLHLHNHGSNDWFLATLARRSPM